MNTESSTKLSVQSNSTTFFARFLNPLSFVVLAFIIILFIAVNRGANKVTKTKEELEYEQWLKTTETNRSTLSAQSLPTLTLRILPVKREEQAKELILDANHHPDGKDRILRILELVRESQILSYIAKSVPAEKPGDVILKIESPDKDYLIRLHADDVNKNVKTVLLLKLFEEYSKDRAPITTSLDHSNNNTNDLPLDLIQTLKGSSATTSDLSPQDGDSK